MIEAPKIDISRELAKKAKDVIRQSYNGFEGKRVKATAQHDRGFDNFYKTMGYLRLADSATYVLWQNALAQVARTPTADVVSGFIRKIWIKDSSLWNPLGRAVYVAAVQNRESRNNYLKINYAGKKRSGEYIRRLVDRFLPGEMELLENSAKEGDLS